MIPRFTAGDITTKLIRDSKNCQTCDNKMLGIFDYKLRTDCVDCTVKCESPLEILTRLQIMNR